MKMCNLTKKVKMRKNLKFFFLLFFFFVLYLLNNNSLMEMFVKYEIIDFKYNIIFIEKVNPFIDLMNCKWKQEM